MTSNVEAPARRYFTQDEIDAVYEGNKAAGRSIFNGCTGVWLRELYGATVAHEPRVGFYMAQASFHGPLDPAHLCPGSLSIARSGGEHPCPVCGRIVLAGAGLDRNEPRLNRHPS